MDTTRYMEVVYVILVVLDPSHKAGIPIAAFSSQDKAQEFINQSKKPEKFTVQKIKLDILDNL